MEEFRSKILIAVIILGVGVIFSCTGDSSSDVQSELPVANRRTGSKGFVLKTGGGEKIFNGIVIKASPKEGTEGSILVEQSFPKGGTTTLHIHDQGDELFYVVSGYGYATLNEKTEMIGPGDVVFVGRGSVHQIDNPDNVDTLKVVFFMDSPELVDEFRAVYERMLSEPGRQITDEEMEAISKRIGGSRKPDK